MVPFKGKTGFSICWTSVPPDLISAKPRSGHPSFGQGTGEVAFSAGPSCSRDTPITADGPGWCRLDRTSGYPTD